MKMYTLCFIRRGTEILLLNRQKAPWMGRWNGVGGKFEKEETSLQCAIREIQEETGLQLQATELHYGGEMKWIEDGQLTGGLDLYVVDLSLDYYYPTPKAMREGILDFKQEEWIFKAENTGMPDNIPFVLQELLKKQRKQRFTCVFVNGVFQSVSKEDW